MWVFTGRAGLRLSPSKALEEVHSTIGALYDRARNDFSETTHS